MRTSRAPTVFFANLLKLGTVLRASAPQAPHGTVWPALTKRVLCRTWSGTPPRSPANASATTTSMESSASPAREGWSSTPSTINANAPLATSGTLRSASYPAIRPTSIATACASALPAPSKPMEPAKPVQPVRRDRPGMALLVPSSYAQWGSSGMEALACNTSRPALSALTGTEWSASP